MPKFVYRAADVNISLPYLYKIRDMAEISAVRYKNLNGIVYAI